MFGRGQRDDLDDDEAAKMAERIRECLREVCFAAENKSSI
jgi:hypothetical protein